MRLRATPAYRTAHRPRQIDPVRPTWTPMDVLTHYLRELAADDLGSGAESPLDPRIAGRCDALRELADLLDREPELVRPAVRRTLEAQLHEPMPGDPTPVVSVHAQRLLRGHGQDRAVTVADHLRLIDELAAAVVRDAWAMAAVGADVLFDAGQTAENLGSVIGLHGFEVKHAAAGFEPDHEYFLHRPSLSEDERRAALSRGCLAVSGRRPLAPDPPP